MSSATARFTPSNDCLAAIDALLAEHLPLAEQDLGALLAREGLLPPGVTLGELSRVYRVEKRVAAFRAVRCGGLAIAVAPGEAAAAAVIIAESLRMVQRWGMASAEAVAARASTITAATVTRERAARLLAALPPVRWLDGDAREWFSFAGTGSGLELAVRKVFSVTGRVALGELKAALAKSLPGLEEAPPAALAAHLTDLAGCTMDGEQVRHTGGLLARPAVTPPEAALVQILDAAGGELDVGELRARGRAAALPKTTVRRVLELSPLFLDGAPGRVRLIGDAGARA